MRSSPKGFTLIELAVVLVIMSSTVAGGLIMWLTMLESAQLKATKEEFITINEAIKIFYNQNSFLPCPASLTDTKVDATFAVATDCSVAAPAGVTDSGSIRIGMLPIYTLNLPLRYYTDGWRSRILYAVTENLAQTIIMYSGSSGAISIQNYLNDPIIDPTGQAAWVVVSHGHDFKGAYNSAGVIKLACTGSARDVENCDNDSTFEEDAYNDGDIEANFFDDIVIWGMK